MNEGGAGSPASSAGTMPDVSRTGKGIGRISKRPSNSSAFGIFGDVWGAHTSPKTPDGRPRQSLKKKETERIFEVRNPQAMRPDCPPTLEDSGRRGGCRNIETRKGARQKSVARRSRKIFARFSGWLLP